jgi:hypothetical protein
MSNIKITELSEITTLQANTSNTLFVGVDIPSGTTSKFSATTLAKGLYSFNPLNVGNNTILFPNTIAQFSGNSDSYLQVNLQNFDSIGSSDLILTADTGTNANSYVDLGINNSRFNPGTNQQTAEYPYDGYLIVQGPDGSYYGNLVIGTAESNTSVVFVSGGLNASNIVATITGTGLVLNTQSYITFADGSTQKTSTSNVYNVITAANTQLKSYVDGQISYLSGTNTTQNTRLSTVEANTIYLFGALNTTNSNIVNANTQLKAYVDGQITGVLSYTSGVDTTQNTRLGVVEANTIYLFGAINATNNNIVNANTQLKAYADGQFLANTSGNLFNGVLNIGDKLNVNGSVVFANTQFSNTQAALTIAACPIGQIQLPSNDGYMLHISGKQNVASRIVFDSYGANTYAVVAGRTARGTPIAPQAVQNGDVLIRISGNGYGTSQFSALGSGRIDIVATENFTDTSRATQIQFFTTVAGTNTQTQIATFNGQSAVFTGVVNPQKGFIYSPNVISGNITTLNIDIANNSLYKFTCNNNTTISLSNFQTGKVVEVWLTNTDTGAGSNHTITHGCYANNSTIGASSFTLSSLHSAYLRYFSIDGDLANTYVSINYS